MRIISFRTCLSFFAFLFGICSCRYDYVHEMVMPTQDEILHMNEIQVIASHNSYRMRTTDTVFSFLQSIASLLPPEYDPAGLDYDHLPLEEQMNSYGMRGLEIDIYYDPQGGVFANRFINSFVGLDTNSNIPELSQPGFKVLHIKDVDYNTHHYTFRSALHAIRTWSLQHPSHIPLFVNIESKQDAPADDATLASIGFQPAPAYNSAAADDIDAEIRDVFGNNLDGIFKPDDLRGNSTSLEAAALGKKWPLLKDCRGKVVFIMEGNGVPFYVQGHPSLSGRAMFVYAQPGTPEAAFVKMNDAVGDEEQIRQLVLAGYMVRSRCDAETVEARAGDYSRMNAALNSGAHICSTDYYRPDPRAGQPGWSSYSVSLPHGMKARKNPVNASGIEVEESIGD